MGYDRGKGKRSDFGIGAFLVGVYDAHEDSFKTVAKIGTGLSDDCLLYTSYDRSTIFTIEEKV